jgi:hypothetical protein
VFSDVIAPRCQPRIDRTGRRTEIGEVGTAAAPELSDVVESPAWTSGPKRFMHLSPVGTVPTGTGDIR